MKFVDGDRADTIFVHFAVIDLCERIETLCNGYRDEVFNIQM